MAFWSEGGWRAALLRGPSGAGKSDLALRAMAMGARLVCDDRTVAWASGGRLFARAPSALAGMIEARGVGIVAAPALALAEVTLVVDLTASPAAVERLPDPAWAEVAGLKVRRISLFALEPSAPAKLALALQSATLGAATEPAYQAQSADEARAPGVESGASQEE